MAPPIIALLTDFGETDYFVPSMKGVIAGINPEVRIMDITHQIPPHNVQAGAFILNAVFRYFPADTIFLAVVDPGVGTSRRILLAQFEGYSFVAPDNGILTYALERTEYPEVREITADHYFISQTGRTFEGRDKMAPIAAWITKNVEADKFGKLIEDYRRLPVEQAQMSGETITGKIVYQDKFGNLISNIPIQALQKLDPELKNLQVQSGEHNILLKDSYSAVDKGRLLALAGSLGSLEIAVREGSAAEESGLRPGDTVFVKKTY